MTNLVGVPGAGCPGLFHVTVATDPTEFDSRSSVSNRLPGQSRDYRYRLLDRALWRKRFNAPIFSVAIRSAGPVLVSHGESRFATQVAVDGEESDVFGFSTPSRGAMTLIRGGELATAAAAQGIAYRLGPGTRLLTSDDSLRTNVFVKAREVEEALEQALDAHLDAPLAFCPFVDWHTGLAASLKCHLDFMTREFARADGIVGNAVGLSAATDLLTALILRGLPHNYADKLALGHGAAAPAYVHRAEEFMRVHCAAPLRIPEIAAAAGCSVRTLGAAFKRFRGRTPLAALHALRLERVHAELSRGGSEASTGAVARQYGFTNAARFAAAFRRQFGETPSEVRRRTGRG